MGFGDMLNRYFSKEEIKSWTSLRKSGYILLPLFIYFLVHDLAEILLWAGVNQLMVKGSTRMVAFLTNNAYTVQGIVNGLMILIGVAAIGKAVKSEILETEGRESYGRGEKGDNKSTKADKPVRLSEKKITAYIMVAVLAFASALGLNILFYLLEITEGSDAYTRAANAQYGVDFFTGLFLYGIVSPFAEEAVFRGVMYNRMKRCFNVQAALFVSALLFGCYHGNIVQAIYGTLLGILIAYIYEKYESFAAPVLFHAVANVSIYALTYHNSLSDISRGAGAIMVAVLTAAMVSSLIYIQRKVKSKEL